MSYQSRQKKRRYKRVERKAKRTGDTSRRWFVTIAKRPGRYDCCRRTFARGDAIVFRYEPRAIRCQRRAERDPESKGYRTSIRYDNARRAAA